MLKRISEETKEKIEKLYAEGISMGNIAWQTGVSYSSVYGLTRARQRTNPDTGKQFESRIEYEKYNARQRTNPDTGKQFESHKKYLEYRTRQITNPDTGKQFESKTEYENYNARQRTKREKNKELSYLISEQLKRLGQTQAWLAEKLGFSRQTFSLYSQGKSLPKGEKLDQLLEIINFNHSKNQRA